MNFFQQQEVARKKTGLFVFYFFVCVLLIITGVYMSVTGFILYLNTRSEGVLQLSLWNPDLFIIISGFTLILVFIGSLYKIISLGRGGRKVAELLGGKLIEPSTQNPKERQLLNVVEEMAIASGTAVPAVYLIPEEGINAFAAGYSPKDAVVGVTQGCMENLNRDQLQGVIAHEFSHIFNGDMRMNIRLMGVLHGILVIALVGQVLLRTRGRKNPLPLLGLVLIVIGYAGVFFGKLIKAAVSRQREFLADASAVQFTRNPDGIAGALKKIGSFWQGSRIKNPKAEEASHFYFANGLGKAWFQAMATHPPLEERVKRIDPSFDGKFGTFGSQEKKTRGGSVEFKQGKFKLGSDEALGSIGNPSKKHLLFAAALIGSLPDVFKEKVHQTMNARAVVYLLLLDKKEEIRAKQLGFLEKSTDLEVFQGIRKMLGEMERLPSEVRLPLIDMAIPALKSLPKEQYSLFRQNVKELIALDQKMDLFEFVLEQVLLRHLDPHFEKKVQRKEKFSNLDPLRSECAMLLSGLARFGQATEGGAVKAFTLGKEKLTLKGEGLQLLSQKDCSIEKLAAALDCLTLVSSKGKQQLLEASTATITADGEVTVEESELLRAIADAFDAPMPPLGVD